MHGYTPPKRNLAIHHIENAKVAIDSLRQNEALQIDASHQWAMETMRSIALFCVAGAAAAFAVMQISEVKMPFMQGIAGAAFLVGFALCIWRMHRSAGVCHDALKQTQKRLALISTNPSITLEEIAEPIVLDTEQQIFASRTYLLGWISAGFASAGAALLIGTIIYKSMF